MTDMMMEKYSSWWSADRPDTSIDVLQGYYLFTQVYFSILVVFICISTTNKLLFLSKLMMEKKQHKQTRETNYILKCLSNVFHPPQPSVDLTQLCYKRWIEKKIVNLGLARPNQNQSTQYIYRRLASPLKKINLLVGLHKV